MLLASIPAGATTTVVTVRPGSIRSAVVTSAGTGTGNVLLVDGYGASDLAVDSVNPLKVTSASHNFVTSDVGQYLRIVSGTGWTVGPFLITAVASNAAFLASSPAAVSTGSGVYTVGSGLTIGYVPATSAIGAQVNFGNAGMPFSLLYATGVANSPVFTLAYL